MIRAKHGNQSDHFDSGWNTGAAPVPTLRPGRQASRHGWLADLLEELQESAMVEGLPWLLPLAGTNRATAVSRQSYYARTQLRELSTLLKPAKHRITNRGIIHANPSVSRTAFILRCGLSVLFLIESCRTSVICLVHAFDFGTTRCNSSRRAQSRNQLAN